MHAGAPDQCADLESGDEVAQESSHNSELRTLPHIRDTWEETEKYNGVVSNKHVLCVTVSMLDHS